MKRKLGKYGLNIAFSTKNGFKTLLGPTKAPIDQMVQFGVCTISCNNCNKVYIEQARRNVETHLSEHLKEIEFTGKKAATDFRSKVAKHVVLNTRIVPKENPVTYDDTT